MKKHAKMKKSAVLAVASVGLAFGLSLGGVIPANAAAKDCTTQDCLTSEVNSFVSKYNGVYLDYDGVYGAQCVDLIKYWISTEYGKAPGSWGNAEAYWNNFESNSWLKANFVQVSKTATPQAGWIAVYQGGTASSLGHIALIEKAGTGTTYALGRYRIVNYAFCWNT